MIRRIFIVVKMLFISFSRWSVGDWIRFWFGSDSTVSIEGYDIKIRSNRFKTKIADLAVVWEVFVDKVYDSFDLGEHDVVLDIGGHIGAFTTKASKECTKGQIFTFEPTPDTFSLLSQNVVNLKNVKVFNVAIADHSGTEHIYMSLDNPGENSLFRKTGLKVDVQLKTLQEFFMNNDIARVNLMKLDCEGAEYSIVTSSIHELKNKVEKIVMEVHEPKYFNVPEQHTIKSLINLLQTNGFEVNFRRDNRYQGYISAVNLHLLKSDTSKSLIAS